MSNERSHESRSEDDGEFQPRASNAEAAVFLTKHFVVVAGGLRVQTVAPANGAESKTSGLLDRWHKTDFIYKECMGAHDSCHGLRIQYDMVPSILDLTKLK